MVYRWQDSVCCLLFLLVLTPIMGLAYLGHFSRFMADDYCSAMIAQSQGIIGGTIHWYLHWTGRFSANLFDSFMGYLGPGITPYSAPVAITLWLLVVIFFIKQFKPLAVAAPAGAVILLSTLAAAPTIEQSVFWGQGMRSVIPPLVLVTGYAGLFLYRLGKKLPQKTFPWLLVSACTAFISAGFSETCAVVQFSLLALAAVVVLYKANVDKDLLLPIGFCLLGTLSGLVLTIAAPGNKVRQAFFPPPPGIDLIIKITGSSIKTFFEKYVLSGGNLPILAGLLLFFSVLGTGVLQYDKKSSTPDPDDIKTWFFLLPLATAALLFASFAPAAYGMSSAPPERTMIVPTFILVCALATWGHSGGQLLGKFLSGNSMVSIVLVSTLFFSIGYLPQLCLDITERIPVYREYATYWDTVDASLRHAKAAGLPHYSVPVIRNWAQVGNITPDSKDWINEAVSNYYGLVVVGK